MRAILLAMLQRRTGPSLAFGVLVGVLCIVAETAVAALLSPVFSAQALTVVYLLGIVVVASVWGLWLGLAMALASAIAFYFFVIPPTLTFWFTNAGDLAFTGVFLVVALLASAFSSLAWSLAAEVEARTEANFAAELARLLLRSPGLREAVPIAAQKLAQTHELPSASIELGSIPPDEGHEAFPLGGDGTVATLLIPVGLPRATMRRVRERAVPSLEVLVQAAQERERAADILRASRDELHQVVDEQTALRRLATLVAHGVAPDQVLAAIAREMGQIMGAGHIQLNRYEPDGTVTCVAVWNRGDIRATMPLGARWPLEKGTVSEAVARTRAPGRIDAYEGTGETLARFRAQGIRSAVGCPIMVGRSLWGVAVVNSSTPEPLPSGTEERVREFTDLAAIAIANAQSNADLEASRARLRASRDELRQVADEQTALRRLATLVAHGVAPDQVLAAIAREMGQTLGAGHIQLNRYEPDGTVTCVAVWNRGDLQATMPVGSRWPAEKGTPAELVARTRTLGRIDSFEGIGEAMARFRARGIRSAVGCPIMVGRSLWGVAVVNSSTPEPLPPGIEERMREFTDLAAVAIANAQSNADLRASRARVVVAADETRRRIERDLHDGAQQRLVTIGLKARAIEAMVPPGMDRLKEELSRLARATDGTLADLQEISRGLHPPILAKAGLSKALTALANRSAVTVDLKLSLDRRLPERLEVTLYYVVSEALTNAAKHAHASVVSIDLAETDRIIRLSIRDDGIGGADPTGGSGLIGLTDRVEALGGTLTMTSSPGQGTSLLAEIPIEDDG